MEITVNGTPHGTIHDSPLAAWNYLRTHTGIEVDRRDATLTEELRILINADNDTLEEALANATMETFLGAFFQLIQPFVAIFRDILSFFEQADANEGQSQWVLKVGDLDLDLDHFRQCISTMTPAGQVTVDVTVPTFNGAWEIIKILRSSPVVNEQVMKSHSRRDARFDTDVLTLPSDVREWVRAYNAGRYSALPAYLTSEQYPPSLRKVATIASAAILIISDLGMNMERMITAYRSSENAGTDKSDALDFWSLAQNETDFWLRTMVVALSSAVKLLKPQELELLDNKMGEFLTPLPTRTMSFNHSFNELESILSLPIWKERYELYSVWVGTEVVRAFRSAGHDLQFHHDGRIAFSFKETEIATVRSSSKLLRLVSERRSPLVTPAGHGRKGNVQPDFGILAGSDEHFQCLMVIEVKHYLRSAKKRFIDVIEDYARANPSAEVYLVNYGPIGDLNVNINSTLRDRCHTIARLTPSHIQERKQLEEAVQKCAGKPVPAWPQGGTQPEPGTIIALDISRSMSSLLNSEQVESLIRSLLETERPSKLAAIDTSINGIWPADRDGFLAITRREGGATSLEGPVRQLLEEFERIVVVTDDDGLAGLSSIGHEAVEQHIEPPAGLCIRIYVRPAS